MRLASYVRKHPVTGIFWYRRAVPPHLRGSLPQVAGFAHNPSRAEFVKTLRTRDIADANRAAARIDVAVQKALDMAEQGSADLGAQPAEAQPRLKAIRVRPQDALAAIERWGSREIAEAEQRIFNGDEALSSWEEAIPNPDAQYHLQQFALAGRSLPDQWKAIPGFDDILLGALATENVALPAGHPALNWLRRSFAAQWSEMLRATESMRQGLWDWRVAVYAPPSPPQSAPPSAATSFLVRVEEWHNVLPLKERQKSMYVSDVRQFSDAIPGIAVESLTRAQAQEWVTKLLGEGLSAKTLRRKLSSLRNYWRFLQGNQIASAANQPFDELWLKGQSNHARKVQRGEKAFTPEEVVFLWRGAIIQGDHDLADVIRLAAFTGGRIEALCAIKKAHIRRDQATKLHVIEMADKSEAGRREVPIHEAIRPLIERLYQNADAAGFIVPTTARNKYQERSTALGKRFGRLKTKHGFDERYVFHSIRKTVATLFERADCPENIAADVLGHDKPTMTFGLYSGGTNLSQRHRWLETAIVYPCADFMKGDASLTHQTVADGSLCGGRSLTTSSR